MKISANHSLAIGCIIIFFIALFVIFGPLFTSYSQHSQNLAISLSSPSIQHPLGTDYYGRDVLTRLIYGGRLSLGIAVFSAIIAVLIGTVLGLFTGYYGGFPDLIIMRFVDVMLAFPRLFIVLLIIGLGGSSIPALIWVIALFSWMEIARIVRSEVMSLKNRTYVKSARAQGFSVNRILFRHILPNTINPVIVATVLSISTIILVESGLSFLGLGVQPPNASWGSILNDAKIDPLGTWWLSVPAGFLILFSVIGFNLIADGITEELDPRQKLTRYGTKG